MNEIAAVKLSFRLFFSHFLRCISVNDILTNQSTVGHNYVFMANMPQIPDHQDFRITFHYVLAKTLGIVECNVPDCWTFTI